MKVQSSKRAFLTALFFLSLITPLSSFALAELQEDTFVIADFDQNKVASNLDTPIEVWLKDNGADATQSCKLSIVKDDAREDSSSHALQLDYDVDSPNPAYNGIRMTLNGFDATQYKAINFYAKGIEANGFSKKLKIEIISSDKPPAPTIVEGITSEWKLFSIPFENFWVSDWSNLDKLVVVFADIVNDPKEGTILLDHIHFSKQS